MGDYKVIGIDRAAYYAPNLATLQQWVHEGRITPEMPVELTSTGQLGPARLIPGLQFPATYANAAAPSPFDAQPLAHYPRPMADAIPDHLAKSIIATILGMFCCCVPIGVVSIIYAAQVGSLKSRGDYAGAMAASRNANTWANITLVLFAVGSLLQIIFPFAAGSLFRL